MARVRNNCAQTIKFLFLLVICYGHIFSFFTANSPGNALMRNWWVLGDIGLFYFSMSSACFTSLHYSSRSSMQGYLSKKVSRIGLQFLFINILLLIYFMVTGVGNIFSVHTIVNFLGLNGFLNWLGIENTSPFGAGQWFITVLFIFYLLYPVLLSVFQSRESVTGLVFGSIMLALLGQYYLPYGHSLWSTCFGFIAGFYFAKAKPAQYSAYIVLGLGIIVAVAQKMLLGNSTVFAYTAIALLGYFLCAITLPKSISWLELNFLRPMDSVFLPLFLLHTYFFKYNFVAEPHVNSFIVLVLNVILAKLVAMAYARFQRLVFS